MEQFGYRKPIQGHSTLNLSLGGDQSPGTCLKPAHTQAHREGTVQLGLCVTEMSKERAGEVGEARGLQLWLTSSCIPPWHSELLPGPLPFAV